MLKGKKRWSAGALKIGASKGILMQDGRWRDDSAVFIGTMFPGVLDRERVLLLV
jgi:hypothetical protein